ncbi:TetR/AcrR family transcriptional regulator [Actinoplanes sp. NPDC049265]|uniref:TetR/AcrR family transcriptional regulator n=1 Tax=Actinoplanes sp. NPDC049265 TaxID=3363902 RepID=UPI0037124E2C
MTTPTPRVDGRTARSERTRNAIVDAHVTLITDGDMRPTADRIAKLAGVSLRALWSHFADMEALMTASAQRILERRDAAHRPISPDLPLAERIDRYCRQRAKLNDLVGPAARAAALKEPFSPALQRYRKLHVERARDEVAALFADVIADDQELLDAITVVSMWNMWDTLRTPMELTSETAAAILHRTVSALLTKH